MLGRLKAWLMNRLSHFLAKVDEPFYTPLNALANLYLRLKNPERIQHLGDLHPDKIFYIIRDTPAHAGLASWYDRVLGYVLRAKRKGWFPVVDPPPPMQADDGGWYDFFKGPGDIPLEEALQGKNVVFATEQGMIHKRYSRRNIARRHLLTGEVGFSDEAKAFVDRHLSAVFEGLQFPVVGVRYRGTDYRPFLSHFPVGHAKVPEVGVFCEEVERKLKEWNIPAGEGEHLYVMTEEAEALDEISRRFPKCRFVVKERYAGRFFEKALVHQRLQTMTPKENNMMYLLEIVALSRCDYLIGGYNGGVLMALNLKGNNYKGVHILKTGVN
jgi:hypothetical protein